VVKIPPEWVTGPGQGKSIGGILQNKYINYKGIKYNANSGQVKGIQEKLNTTCK
jgi:hypothetical protein